MLQRFGWFQLAARGTPRFGDPLSICPVGWLLSVLAGLWGYGMIHLKAEAAKEV